MSNFLVFKFQRQKKYVWIFCLQHQFEAINISRVTNCRDISKWKYIDLLHSIYDSFGDEEANIGAWQITRQILFIEGEIEKGRRSFGQREKLSEVEESRSSRTTRLNFSHAWTIGPSWGSRFVIFFSNSEIIQFHTK